MKAHVAMFAAGLATASLIGAAVPPLRSRTHRLRPRLRPLEPVDLNTATAMQLARLPGVNMGLAMRIIENRPYRNKLDLVSRMIVPEYIFERMRSRVMVSREAAQAPIEIAT
jgi:DNA uptake protein ComE-like DNA-binding protein